MTPTTGPSKSQSSTAFVVAVCVLCIAAVTLQVAVGHMKLYFKKEPVAAKYESASQALAKTCADGGAQFNAETVQCVAAPTKEK